MLKKGTEVQFIQMNDFTGKEMLFKGVIIGHAKEARKTWPEECGAVTDPAYVVKRKDAYGNTFNHLVFPEEFFSVAIKEKELLKQYFK